jgi:VanZ family protein
MQKPIKSLFKGNVLVLTSISITLFIGYLSLKKTTHFIIQLSHIDKAYHTVAYFLLAFSWLFSFPKSFENRKLKYTIVIWCIMYGIIIEVLQGTLTIYRSASLLDVLANTVGIILAMVLFKQFYKKYIAI